MKTLKHLGIFLVLTLTIISCEGGEDPERAAKLEEAGKIHDEGLTLGGEVKEMTARAETLINQFGEEQQEEIVPHVESIEAVKEDYKIWQETMVEVPGHAHTHHEGHHHHDHSMDNAPAEDIIKKQEELRDFIADAHNRIIKTVEALQIMLDEM